MSQQSAAAARIVAHAPPANGRVKTVEVAALDPLDALERRGLNGALQGVVGAPWADRLDPVPAPDSE